MSLFVAVLIKLTSWLIKAFIFVSSQEMKRFRSAGQVGKDHFVKYGLLTNGN